MQYKRSFHLNSSTIDDKWLKATFERKYDPRILQTIVVRTVPVRFPNLSSTIGSDINDHVAFGPAIVRWPCIIRHIGYAIVDIIPR